LKKNPLMIQKITLLFSILYLFFSLQINAQISNNKAIDSLKHAVKKSKNNAEKTVLFTRLSSYTGYIDSDEAIKYAQKALYYAKKENNPLKISDAYGNIGIIYEIKSDYVNALTNLHKALEINLKHNDHKRIIRTYNNIGLIYIDLKNYNQGLFFYNKALQLSYKTKEDRIISLLSNNIGDVYLQKKEYKKALPHFYKALITNKKLKDTEGIGLNLSNIGICYINLKNYDKGIEKINQSITNYEDYNSLYNTYNIYELGRIYFYKSIDETLPNAKKQNLNKSIAYFNQSLENFKKYKSLKDLQDTYYYLYKTNKTKGDKDLALKYFENYSTIKDSLFSKESTKKLANLEFQREIDLKNKQIEIQKLKIKSNTRKVYFLIALTIGVIFFLILFLWLYISKRKNNKIITAINSQKDKFFSIIAHDLRGPFNGFLGLTELMAEDIDTLSSKDIKYAAVNMRSSAKNLFNLLENLLEWSRMEQGLIPFDPKNLELESTLLESILTLHDSALKKEITINTDIDNVKTFFADKNMFQAIIRNIVMNAIKFTNKKGQIDIQAKEELKSTIISIKDTGIGMSSKIVEDLFKLDVQNNRFGTEEEPSTGLGLILCKEFIEKHKGKIWVESEEGKGSTFFISFPKKQ
jgi:signal transduction histidine kinase/lipopolysaccharide biosynthesis regulator YciM